MKRTIAAKVQLIYITLFVLIILTTVVISYVSSIRQLENQVIGSNQNVLSQISKRVDSVLQEIDLTTINFLRNNESRSFFESSASDAPQHLLGLSMLQDQLGNILGANFNMKAVFLYSTISGKLISASDYYDLDSAAGMSWIKSFTSSNKVNKWTASPPDAHSSDFLLVRNYPFTAGPKDRSGVMVTQINEKSISKMFSDLQFSDSYNVFLVDQNGNILSHKDSKLIHQSILDQSYSAQVLSKEGHGYVTETTAHGKNLIFYDNSAYTGWKLIYVVSQHQLSTLSLTVRYILIGMACLMLVVATLTTRFVNHRWFAPMEYFIARLEEITKRTPLGLENGRTSPSLSYNELHSKIEQVFSGYSNAEKKLHESIPALKLQIMFDILTGNKTKFEFAEPMLNHVGIDLYPEHYIVLTMEYDNKAMLEKVGDMNLYLYALCNVAEEIIRSSQGEIKGAAVQMNDFQAVMILSFRNGGSTENTAAAKALGEHFMAYIKGQFRRTLSIGIGGHYDHFSDIRKSYLESAALVSCKILLGPSALITSDDVESWNSGRLLEVFESIDDLIETVKQVNVEKTGAVLEELFKRAARCNLTKEMMVQLCLQVILKALRTAADPALNEQFQAEHETVLIRLQRCETLYELRAVLGSLMDELIQSMNDKRNNKKKSSELIESILSYITEHYNESDISVNYLADRFNISPNYLSKLFKEYTFSNFVDYLIEVRMKSAHRLLLETPMKLNEIAQQVGYTNFSSFLRNFKKYYGMTPTEYRQLHLKHFFHPRG